MVILTFIRHGETDFNKYGILQGHLNIPLNQNGRHESAILGNRLSSQIDEFPIDLIISSDLDRASETALIIHQFISIVSNHPIPVLQTPLLRERYLGKLEGVDLKQLAVNWKELTEQPKQMIDIQKILSIRNISLNSILQQQQQNTTTFTTSSSPTIPNLSITSNKFKNVYDTAPTTITTTSTTTTFSTIDATSKTINTSTSSSIDLSSSSASSTEDNISSTSEESSEISNDDYFSNSNTSTISNPSSLSSSTSSLSSVDDQITNNNINTNNINNNNSINNTTSSPNIKLTSNVLKHLPQKELKIESKSKLIKRAKEAFQYILKQIPSTFIKPTATNTSNNINENESTEPKKDFHIVIVSHNVMLRALVSLLFCKKSSSPASNLLCKLSSPSLLSSNSSNSSNGNTNNSNGNTSSSTSTSTSNNLPTQTQSESSSRNFKWVQFEFKNNHLLRTSFDTIEKKSLKNNFKRIPRNIELLHFTDPSQQPLPIKNIITNSNSTTSSSSSNRNNHVQNHHIPKLTTSTLLTTTAINSPNGINHI